MEWLSYLSRKRLVAVCFVVCALAVAGCGGGKDGPGKDAGPDGRVPDDGMVPDDGSLPDGSLPVDPDEDDGLTDEPLSWNVTDTDAANGVIVEKINYLSHGLTINGEICRPDDDEVHPYLVYNHGGFVGITAEDRAYCKELASAPYNYVVVMSEYRGEGGSGGQIEVCHGEADDVRRIDAIARVMFADILDLERVGVIGFSHGGCVTMRALLKGLDVDVAVNVYGLGDLKKNYAFLNQIITDYGVILMGIEPQGVALLASINLLLTQIELQTGGLPTSDDAEVNANYYARSPVLRGAKLADSDFDFLLLHGLKDYIVPFAPNCVLVDGMGDVKAWHITAPDVGAPTVTATPPAECDLDGIEWQSTVTPEAFTNKRNFLFFDGGAHTFGDQFDAHQGPLMKAAAFGFLEEKL